MGIKGGEMVMISSRRGRIKTTTHITDIIPSGTVFVPFHFAESAANVLFDSKALDPTAKIPALKACAVQIVRADKSATSP